MTKIWYLFDVLESWAIGQCGELKRVFAILFVGLVIWECVSIAVIFGDKDGDSNNHSS